MESHFHKPAKSVVKDVKVSPEKQPLFITVHFSN